MNKGKTPPKERALSRVGDALGGFLTVEKKEKRKEHAAQPVPRQVIQKEGEIEEQRKKKDAEKKEKGIGKAGHKTEKEQS